MSKELVYAIRHARSSGDSSQRYLGRTDPPLGDEGRTQAEKILSRWPAAKDLPVWSSPLRRAQETARLGFPNANIHCEQEAVELNFGILDGLLPEEAALLFPEAVEYFRSEPLDAGPFGGENWRNLLARASNVASRIELAGSLVLVSHRYFLAALVACLAPDAPHVTDNLNYATALVFQRDTPGAWRLLSSV
jgi:broad specificity phosphatase PhoE